MSRGLPRRAVLAGIDLAAHRERAVCALALYFADDFKVSPAVWEEKARAALAQLDAYGVVPVWLFDPVFEEEGLRALVEKIGRGVPVTAVDIEAAGLPVKFFNLAGPGA